MPDPAHAILYDRDCGFCRWSLDKVLAWDRRRRLRPVAIQSPEGDEMLSDLEPGRRLESWHLVFPDGRVLSGASAAAPLAELLPAGRPLAWGLRSFPGVTERGYRWVAANRGKLARLLRISPGSEPRRG